MTAADSRKRSAYHVVLALLLAGAAVLRFASLGGEFISEDDVRQTFRVIHNPGYVWMINWATGVLGPLIQKLAMSAVVALGLQADEFWWRTPSVVAGLLQILLTYPFALRLGLTRNASLLACATLAVLPVHVANSRYTWGHEITGLCCLTLAMWSLHAFYQRPGARRAVVASCLTALYLISHHYIVAFFPSALFLSLASSRSGRASVLHRLRTATLSSLRYGVWILPVLVYPLYATSFDYVAAKPTRPGIYLDTHAWLFVEAVGLFVALAVTVLVPIALRGRPGQARTGLALSLCGACYLAPLVFGAPPNITNVKGYMLIGSWWLILAAASAAAPVLDRVPRWSAPLATGVVGLTLWGTLCNVFERSLPNAWDPSLANVEWGRALRAPGRKTAGYLVQHSVPPDTALYLAQHIMEWPARYYFGRTGCRLPDVNFPYRQVHSQHPCVRYADVIVTDAEHRWWVAQIDRLELEVEIREAGAAVLWIYAIAEMSFPVAAARTEDFDHRFDAELTDRLRDLD